MSRCIFALLVTMSLVACAEEQPAAGSKLSKSEQGNIERIKCEIELLASKNSAPLISGPNDDLRLRFQPEYDKSAQVPVYLAFQQLLREGEAGIDLLLAHSDDDRYSFTVAAVGPMNVPVSRACFLSAQMQVLCFEGETTYFSRDQVLLYPGFEDPKQFADWWQKNKGRGLAALQLEAIDKMLEYTRTADWNKARGRYLSEGRDDKEYFDRCRDQNIPILESIRATIIAGKRPYQPSAISNIHRGQEFVGVPWFKGLINP